MRSWHTPDGEWRHVATLTGHTATCIAVTDAIHVGSSEARLFRLNGRTLEPVEAFDALEGRDAWYTPGAVLPTRGRSPSGAKMFT